MTSSVAFGASKKKEGTAGLTQQYPLDLKDLRVVLKEKIQITKIGIENDNWLMHAIKSKHLEACLYLL